MEKVTYLSDAKKMMFLTNILTTVLVQCNNYKPFVGQTDKQRERERERKNDCEKNNV
jgi:hypothetical protein